MQFATFCVIPQRPCLQVRWQILAANYSRHYLEGLASLRPALDPRFSPVPES